MRIENIFRKAKNNCYAKMKGAEIGRNELTQCLVEHVGVFPKDLSEAAKGFNSGGKHEIISCIVNHSTVWSVESKSRDQECVGEACQEII